MCIRDRLLRDGVVDGSSGILHIRADILNAFRKADGAVLVLDVRQPDFISGKINRVDSALDAIHIQRRADRNVLCGFEMCIRDSCYRELLPTLEYVKQEQKQEKPSIRDQLRTAAKQQPEKKSPVKSKTHDMEL